MAFVAQQIRRMATENPSPEAETYDPLTPVPEARRSFTLRDAFSLWFSLGIGLLVLQAGAGLIPGLSLGWALAAIVAGSTVGAILLALAGVIGADTGLGAIAALRPTLGVRGAAVPAILNVIQLVGWGAFEIIAMRDAAGTLAKSTFHFDAPVVWTLAFGAAATALAVVGPLGFVRRILRRGGMWLVLAGAAWLTWTLLSRHDLTQLFARAGDGSLGFGAGVDIVAAMPLSWLPLIADYSRFGTSAKAMFRGSTLGYLLANIWFYALGAAYALAARTDPNGLLLSALATTGGGLALLMILIDETDNAFANIFSAAMSTATVFRFRILHLVIGFGTLCTGLALFLPMTQFTGFLYIIGSVFAPLYGVLLVDHFIVRKRQVDAADIDRMDGAYGFEIGVHMAAFAAWIIGVVTYYLIVQFSPGLGATLPALVMAGLSYWGLKRLGL